MLKAYLVTDYEREFCVVVKASSSGKAKIHRGVRDVIPDEQFIDLRATRCPEMDNIPRDIASDRDYYESKSFACVCDDDHSIHKEDVGEVCGPPFFHENGTLTSCPYCRGDIKPEYQEFYQAEIRRAKELGPWCPKCGAWLTVDGQVRSTCTCSWTCGHTETKPIGG